MFVTDKPTILIVDDDLAILHTFRRIFERNGFSVAVAPKGEDAKVELKRRHFDIALIDFCLPDMEGVELFPTIDELSPQTLKVIITGKSYLADSIHGVDVFIAKPVDPARLLGIIDTQLKCRDIEK